MSESDEENVAEEMYKASGAQGQPGAPGTPPPGAAPGAAPGGKKDDVVDAEFRQS